MSEQNSREAFNSLLEQYYGAWFRYHPEQAVHVGVNGYEEKLTPFDEEEIGALISLNQKVISALDELEVAELDESQRLDFTILYNAVNIELQQLIDDDWRYRRPQNYLPLEAIHQLVNRPVENVHQALKHRLQAIPGHLRAARNYLDQKPENIPAEWLDDAIASAEAGVDYLRNVLRNPMIVSKFQNPARLQPVCDDAAHAMEDFARFLKQDLQSKAKGSFACGRKHFDELLNDWHCLDLDADQLHAFGEKLFNETREQLEVLSRELPGEHSIESQLSRIRENHPQYDNNVLLDAYRNRMKAAFDFVRDKQLVTMPESQSLKVVETPVFLRHEIPFAAYDEPTYSDPEQRGYYYVTPVRSQGHMLEHNWISIDLTCVHEAFPGHHLQFATANQNPRNSLPRMLNASATLYEGWALYCEDLMHEQGFLDKPDHQFIMLRDRLWRAMRVMIDVELHTRGLSIDDAAQRMCNELGFSIDQARADLNWYCQSPTVPMGYATGWALIRALRDEVSSQEGFSLKMFHDQLLSVGSCALPLVIKCAFGDDAWRRVHARVFGSDKA